ncbi:hypothetical protein HK097_010969, partial [Rhizophlyctis rosea]
AFLGGVSLLVSSITGPGIITIPLIFQEAGWIMPTVLFIAVAFLSGIGALFLLESMTYFPGNDKFQMNVEFTVLVHQFYGRRWYYLMHVILFGSLQSFNIASIISAVQSFDYFFISLFGTTCGYGISPESGFICRSELSNSNSPFGDNYMLFTFGFVLLVILVLPLVSLDLNDSMIVQLLSVAYLMLAILVFIILSFIAGLKTQNMPAKGSNMSQALGNIMFNYTLANTVPSWVNTKHKSVPIKKTIWTSIWVATAMYLIIGWFGGAAFPMPGSNLISAIQSSDDVSSSGKVVNNILSVTYPILVLLTSIPVSMIIIRMNLISSRICSKGGFGSWDVEYRGDWKELTESGLCLTGWASFWGTWLPFVIAVPFQTGNWVTIFANWTSLVFQSLCNFVAPFMVYLYLHKRNLVMQESVIEELEFLEIDTNLKKYREDDDDFDYCYHLPHADLSKLGARTYNPFGPSQSSLAAGPQMNFNARQQEQQQGGHSDPNTQPGSQMGSTMMSGYPHRSVSGLSTAGMSTASGGPSKRQLMKQMLGPMGGGAGRLRGNTSGPNSSVGSRMASSMALGGGMPGQRGPGSVLASRRGSNSSRAYVPYGMPQQQSSTLGVSGLASFQRRLSMIGGGPNQLQSHSLPVPGSNIPPLPSNASQRSGMFGGYGGNNPNRIHPMSDYDDVEAKGSMMLDKAAEESMKEEMREIPEVEDVTGSLGYFRAMPPWLGRWGIHPRWVAWVSFVLLFGGSLVVLALEIINVAQHGIDVKGGGGAE